MVDSAKLSKHAKEQARNSDGTFKREGSTPAPLRMGRRQENAAGDEDAKLLREAASLGVSEEDAFDEEIMQEARVKRLGADLGSMPDDHRLTQEELDALSAAGVQQMRDNPNNTEIGLYTPVRSDQARELLGLDGMDLDDVIEAAWAGGWDRDQDEYVVWTRDGYLRGMDREWAAELAWKGRTQLIDPNHLSKDSYDRLHAAFAREETPRNVSELRSWMGKNAKEAQRVEFDRLPDGTGIKGWAVEDRELSRDNVPDGWHVYSVSEWDSDEPDEDFMRAKGIDPDTADEEDIEYRQVLLIDKQIDSWSNHRFDFATREDLSDRIRRQPIEINDTYGWGFTGDRLIN